MQTVLKNHTFVGARRYEYDFDGNNGRITGTAYYVSLVEEEPLGFPVEVKCNQAQHDELVAAGFGAIYDATVEVQAKNNKVVYVAQELRDSTASVSN